MAVLSLYKMFIYGIFNVHTVLIVTLIALGQIFIATLLFIRKSLFKTGIAGGIIFLITIAPIGIGSAFPSTLLMAASLIILYSRSQRFE